MEDAAANGDYDVNTLRSVSASSFFHVPNMKRLGLFDIEGVTVGEKEGAYIGRIARLK